jgi:hypothetical protein
MGERGADEADADQAILSNSSVSVLMPVTLSERGEGGDNRRDSASSVPMVMRSASGRP